MADVAEPATQTQPDDKAGPGRWQRYRGVAEYVVIPAFAVIAALAAFGVVWLADRPGDVAIVWQGYRIETSIMVAAAAMIIVVLVAVLAWSIVRTILRSPDHIKMFLSQRRGVRGYLAISRGLIAVGAGDAATARRAADEAQRIAPGAPLTLLLNAQHAQLSGDRAAADARNHGDFVSDVALLTNGWAKSGLLNDGDKGAIQRAAARAKIP